ncbi:MAG: GNAT family N-acetyltransferase [Methylotenera sp.]|jgi:acetyltransferase|nr:GNAT family N-acetyltransferase [Methylotenera sp.]
MTAALLKPPASPPTAAWATVPGTRLRLLEPEDVEAERRFFNGLSLDSRHQRFHVGLRELSPALLTLLTDVDQQRHRAWVVERVDAPVPTFIADARFVSDAADPGRAEFALAVADAWQGRGLGRRLLAHLQADARAQGVHTLFGEVLAENRRMLALMREAGMRLQPHLADGWLVRGTWAAPD